MLCVDVNVLVYAHRADLPQHEVYADLLTGLANGGEPVGLPDIVLSGFVRVITNRRIFNEPTTPSVAWDHVDRLVGSPAGLVLHPTVRHWSHFRGLAASINARGNDLSDAFIAAYAIDNNATLLSADRGFARFTALRWRHPVA